MSLPSNDFTHWLLAAATARDTINASSFITVEFDIFMALFVRQAFLNFGEVKL